MWFITWLICTYLQILTENHPLTSRPVVPGGAWDVMATPYFGRSLKLISTKWGRLCSSNYYCPLPYFWTLLRPCTKTRGIELLESRHAADIAVDISIEMALGPKQKVVAVAVNPSFICWTWDTSNMGLEGWFLFSELVLVQIENYSRCQQNNERKCPNCS